MVTSGRGRIDDVIPLIAGRLPVSHGRLRAKVSRKRSPAKQRLGGKTGRCDTPIADNDRSTALLYFLLDGDDGS